MSGRTTGKPGTRAAAGEQRRTRRAKVFLPTEVATPAEGETRRAHLLDISTEGARVHARSGADAGALVELVVDGRAHQGSVVWVKHPTFGVRFATPLSSERLGRIVAPD